MTWIPIVVGTLRTFLQGRGKKSGGTGNQRKNRDHPDHSRVERGHNTEESPRVPRRFAVFQTPVKSHQVMLV